MHWIYGRLHCPVLGTHSTVTHSAVLPNSIYSRPVGCSSQLAYALANWLHWNTFRIPIGSILNPLAGKFPNIPERRVKARKQGHLTIGGALICRNMIG